MVGRAGEAGAGRQAGRICVVMRPPPLSFGALVEERVIKSSFDHFSQVQMASLASANIPAWPRVGEVPLEKEPSFFGSGVRQNSPQKEIGS